MGQTPDPRTTSLFCGFEGEDWDAHCERCGRPVSTWGILRDVALMERAA